MTLVQAAQRKVTYTDLESWPDDGRRYELYDGEVYVCPAPFPRHQIATQELFSPLRQYALRTGGLVLVSPIDIVFDQFNVLQPDIAFFQASRRHHVSLDKVTRVPPDVVVEVISPGTVRNDLGRKKATFAQFGVPEYWLLDPHIERMERHSLANGTYECTLSVAPGADFRSDVIDGFACAVSSLFPW
jgi:Uma2 family endonuclease